MPVSVPVSENADLQVQELASVSDNLQESVAESGPSSESIVSESLNLVQTADNVEPQISAATELDSGGGVFMPWWLGVALFFRRKSAAFKAG